jgi:hypothetical protein
VKELGWRLFLKNRVEGSNVGTGRRSSANTIDNEIEDIKSNPAEIKA